MDALDSLLLLGYRIERMGGSVSGDVYMLSSERVDMKKHGVEIRSLMEEVDRSKEYYNNRLQEMGRK